MSRTATLYLLKGEDVVAKDSLHEVPRGYKEEDILEETEALK